MWSNSNPWERSFDFATIDHSVEEAGNPYDFASLLQKLTYFAAFQKQVKDEYGNKRIHRREKR